jgi:hypothetical protein
MLRDFLNHIVVGSAKTILFPQSLLPADYG